MTTTAAAPKPKTDTPSRMSLAAVTRGRIDQPLRVLLYGVEGIGKSTFGAGAPSPIFLGAEDGTATMDVARMPMPSTWNDVIDGLRALLEEPHEFRTLVVDTVNSLEPMVWRAVCQRGGKESIEDFGYGKGYADALDMWRDFVAQLDALRGKGMHVVLLAHAGIRQFKNPEGEDFDRYEVKLHTKASAFLREWVDVVGFANYETFAKTDPKTKRSRGISTGARLINTQHSAAYDAKNRYDLPEQLALDWATFYEATKARQVAPTADLVAAVTDAAQQLAADDRAKALAALERDKADPQKLAALLNRINAKAPRTTTKETA